MKILGIETSCDETAASVVKDDNIVLSNIVASQADIHSKYGGIVPEVASRMHLESLPLVVEEALKQAKTEIDDIESIAFASNPGLPPALSTGFGYSSALASILDIDLLEINHLEAHIKSIWLREDPSNKLEIPYPYVCLVVSGGHTQLHLVKDAKTQNIIGKTKDDAAGEAFDKVARMLDMGYPGGPVIDSASRKGDEATYDFPRPMIDSDDNNFSFSGLKTAVFRKIEELKKECEPYIDQKDLYNELCKNWNNDVAASFQEAVVDTLVEKTVRAVNSLGIENIAMAGGVSANSRLRNKFGRIANELNLKLFYPELKYCGDNAAMIASRAFDII